MDESTEKLWELRADPIPSQKDAVAKIRDSYTSVLATGLSKTSQAITTFWVVLNGGLLIFTVCLVGGIIGLAAAVLPGLWAILAGRATLSACLNGGRSALETSLQVVKSTLDVASTDSLQKWPTFAL